jgi:predicted metal-dependent peptidase
VGIDKVPEKLRNVCEGIDFGNSPSEAEREIQGHGQGQVPWQRLLHRYAGQILEVRPVFTRPPRRFPDLVGIIPGKGRQQDKPKILAIIDTSGSITEELVVLIDAELARLAKSYDVTVVECDCEIHAVYRYKPVKAVQGGGGTDFHPPLEPVFLQKHKPDLIVYFTDGEGPAPEKSPRVPVIWCLTPEGERPATWGREIRMVEKSTANE